MRAFAAGDEGSLVEAWNRSLRADPTTPGWFRDCVLLDPNFDPEGLRVAVVDGQVVGCAYGVRRLTPLAPGTDLEPEAGWIPFFFVVPEYRGSGLGRRLVEEAVAFLRGQGRVRVDFASYTPNYVLPGADPEAYPEGFRLLERLGFTTLYSPVAMDRSLVGYVTPDDVHGLQAQRESEGYGFRSPRDGELPELIRFAADRFNPDWGEAIRAHRTPARIVIATKDTNAANATEAASAASVTSAASATSAAKTTEAAKAGNAAETGKASEGANSTKTAEDAKAVNAAEAAKASEDANVADATKTAEGNDAGGARIVGFALYGAYRGVGERFGPFGVDPELQGTGLGKILLHLTMTRMRAEGLHSSWFLWTGEQSPAGHLYAKAGYTVTRRFHVMRRTG